MVGKSLPNNLSLTQEHDGLGRVTRMHYTHPASGTVEDLAYTYDENSNRTSETSVEGLSSTVFDPRNQLIQTSYPAAPGGNPAIEDFRYDDAGNRLERRHIRDEAAGSVESSTKIGRAHV